MTTNITTTKTRKTNPVKINYLYDLLILIVFLVLFDPHVTGVAIHEWLGIAFGAALVTHLLLHWKWLVATTRRFLGRLPWATRLNYVLNSLLFIVMTVLIFSGLMMSESALPALGIRLPESRTWHSLHALAGDWALIVLALHVALHWKWILSTTRRYVINPILSRLPRRAAARQPRLEVASEEAAI